MVHLSVCLSVTLVRPAKAVAQNETPFGRNTVVIPCNIMLPRGPGPPRRDLEFGALILDLEIFRLKTLYNRDAR